MAAIALLLTAGYGKGLHAVVFPVSEPAESIQADEFSGATARRYSAAGHAGAGREDLPQLVGRGGVGAGE